MASTGKAVRPRVAVAKFASCDGCQLTILDLEEQLLEIVTRFDIVEFPEATSRHSPGPYDVVFVEGSVSAPEHLDQIKALRKQARLLVTIGACATAGGIQALRNWADHDAYRAAIYAHPEWIESLATATPVADHVKVDAELRGCPIDGGQLLEVLTAVLVGRRPQIRDEVVCRECKRKGLVSSPPARPAWARSPPPAATRCAPHMAAAATVASVRGQPPTPGAGVRS